MIITVLYLELIVFKYFFLLKDHQWMGKELYKEKLFNFSFEHTKHRKQINGTQAHYLQNHTVFSNPMFVL